MSTDISWLLEVNQAGQWAPATDIADRLSDPRTHLGIVNVCWWSVRSCRTSLFFGPDAIIPFNLGLPQDLSAAIHEYVQPNFADDMTYAGWISLAELDLPSWHEQKVIVGGPVKAEFATLFGDGSQPPPIDALRDKGFTEPVLENTTDWKSKRQLAFSQTPSHKLRKLPRDFLVDVTWVESLADFVGSIWHDGLSQLATIDQPEKYRVVTAVG